MTSLQRAIRTTAVAAATLIGVSLPAMADVVTITDFLDNTTPQGGNGAVESVGTTAVTLAGPVWFNVSPNTSQGLFTIPPVLSSTMEGRSTGQSCRSGP